MSILIIVGHENLSPLKKKKKKENLSPLELWAKDQV